MKKQEDSSFPREGFTTNISPLIKAAKEGLVSPCGSEGAVFLSRGLTISLDLIVQAVRKNFMPPRKGEANPSYLVPTHTTLEGSADAGMIMFIGLANYYGHRIEAIQLELGLHKISAVKYKLAKYMQIDEMVGRADKFFMEENGEQYPVSVERFSVKRRLCLNYLKIKFLENGIRI